MRTILVTMSLLAAPALVACTDDADRSPEVDPGAGGKSDSTWQALTGSYYAFDGVSWNVLSMSRPTTTGTGTYLSYQSGEFARGNYSIVDDRLTLTTGFGASEVTLVNTFKVYPSAWGPVLVLTNDFGTAAMVRGAMFCQAQADCTAQSGVDAYSCTNHMCVPKYVEL